MAEATLPNGTAPATETNGVTQSIGGISADEIALYDRQIRLWGVQAQERLRLADVLIIGMRGLGNEIAKNLILAGINSLTIVDDTLVTEDDLGAQFFLSEENIGQIRSEASLPAAKALNPRVKVFATPLGPFLTTPSFFGSYTVIIVTDQTLTLLTQINVHCRLVNRPFYAASTYGLYGYIFADLIAHDFTITREKSNIPTTIGPETPTRQILSATVAPRNSENKLLETVTKRETYVPINLANTSPLPSFHLSTRRRKFAVSPILSCIRALWDYQSRTGSISPTHTPQDLLLFTTLAKEKHSELQLPAETLRAEILKSFCQNLASEVSPVCAFLGGQLSQDVINVLGGREQPIQNFVVFDGEELKGVVYCLWTDMERMMSEVVGQVNNTAAAGAVAVAGTGSGEVNGNAGDGNAPSSSADAKAEANG